MKKTVKKTYLIYLIIVAVLFLYMLATFKLDVEQQTVNYGSQIISDYTVKTYVDKNAPLGIREEYVFQIPDVNVNHNYLMFYTCHQNVNVYLEEECIYKMNPSSQNAFGKSSGYVWNTVFFDPEDAGKTLRVCILPVYQNVVGAAVDFHFGNAFVIMKDVVSRDIWSILLSLAAIIMGIVFILFHVCGYRNPEFGSSLSILGCFAILVGYWQITDTETFALLSTKYLAFAYTPFLALMLLGIPFVLYISEMRNFKNDKIWYIPCMVSFVQIAVVLLLQIFNIADVRETLFLSHLVIAMMVIVCIIMVCREVKRAGWSSRLKRNAIGMGACFVGTLVDVFVYYFSNAMKVTLLATFAFVVYVFILGFSAMQDTRRVIDIGIQAWHFEQIAYHDQLTGLHNRTAYAAEIGKSEFEPEKCIVVMFDLNDLKKCNDKLGHDKGDVYIRESACIIEECFGDLGDCYRMGGDEFCVLFKKGSLELCRQRIALLHKKVAEFNERNTEIHMQIACGFEMYDKRIDYDIGDTARRADKMMYHEKYTMKQTGNPEMI